MAAAATSRVRPRNVPPTALADQPLLSRFRPQGGLGGAVDVVTLRNEQERINREARSLQERLASVDTSLAEWQEVLDIAIRFASDCAGAYRRADDRTRTLFNAAVFEQLLVRDGRVGEARYRAPFDLLFTTPRFEYEGLVGGAGLEPAAFSV